MPYLPVCACTARGSMIALFVGMSVCLFVCLFVCEHKMNSLSESGMCAMLASFPDRVGGEKAVWSRQIV